MYKYNVGDIIIRTGNTWNKRLATITEVFGYDYGVEFIDCPKVKGMRWSPRYFELHQTANREPDWEV